MMEMTRKIQQDNNITVLEEVQILSSPVWYILVEVSVGVLALLGNALVIIAFTANRRLRKLTNYYIVSLAIADLLVGLLGIPFAILTYIGLPTHHLSCLFTLSVLVILCTTSILCLLAVSVDRYWAIMRPFDYQRLMNGKIAIRIIIGCWFVGAVIGLMPLTGWNSGKMDHLCLFEEVISYSYLVFLYVATIIFPGVLMACFYLHIYIIVVRRMKLMAIHCSGSSASSLPFRGRVSSMISCGPPRRDIKAAKSLFIIVVFFMICWLPLYTINCINAFCSHCRISGPFLDATIILTHANSAINPFLYALNMKDFRKEMKNIITKMFKKPTGDIRVLGSPSLPLRSIDGSRRPRLGRQVTFEDPERAAEKNDRISATIMRDRRTTDYAKFPPRRKSGVVQQFLEDVLLIILHTANIPTQRESSQEHY